MMEHKLRMYVWVQIGYFRLLHACRGILEGSLTVYAVYDSVAFYHQAYLCGTFLIDLRSGSTQVF